MSIFENLEAQAERLKYYTEQVKAIQSEFVGLLEHSVMEKQISENQRKQIIAILLRQSLPKVA